MEDFNQAMANIEEGMDRAQTSADEAAVLPYVVGCYIGNGQQTQDIYLGFRPRFVILGSDQRAGGSTYGGLRLLVGGENVSSERFFITDTGFRLDLTEARSPYPAVNEKDAPYDYIAFR